MKILAVFGTRPEAIKMAPLLYQLKQCEGLKTQICVTAQHREMLDQVLQLFQIVPHYDFNIMEIDQSLAKIACAVLSKLEPVLEEYQPDLVLVQGDTATTFAASLAAFYKKISIAHVEAGLRSHNFYKPWPEEMNRVLTGRLAQLHFAPTQHAANNLIREGVFEENIFVTGNTVIDALFMVTEKLSKDVSLISKLEEQFSYLDKCKKLILVTGHRRESFGEGLKNICEAIAKLAERKDAQVIYSLHLNAHVQCPVKNILSSCSNVYLIEPQDYLSFVYLMLRSYIILTDSGGIQEEAPSLGKPVLVMRDTTERPEAVEAGTVKLVGVKKESIIHESMKLLDDRRCYDRMNFVHNPYGDGHAAKKIVEIIQGVMMKDSTELIPRKTHKLIEISH